LLAYSFKVRGGRQHGFGRTTLGGLGPQIALSNPAFGAVTSPVDAAAGSGAFAPPCSCSSRAAMRRRTGWSPRCRPAHSRRGEPAAGHPRRPDVTRFRLTRKRFRLGGLGTVIKWSQSEAGTDTIRFERRVNGRGASCRRKMRFQSHGRGPEAALPRPLRPEAPAEAGRYRMTLTARDAAGNVSLPDRARFTLLRKKRR
jgi:hypothetical protein